MLEWIQSIFSTNGFPARWQCGIGWYEQPYWGWIHIVSDLLTWGAYTAIPFVLMYFLWNRRDVPFPRIFWLFVAFIFACGTVHLVESIIFWMPLYRLSALVKLTTALVSWATVISLLPIIPVALTLRSPKQLESELALRVEELQKVNAQLEQEIAERAKLTDSLQEQDKRLRLALEAGGMGTWDWDMTSNEMQTDQAERDLIGLANQTQRIALEKFFEQIHPEDRATAQECFRVAREHRSTFQLEFRIVTSTGEVKWIAGRGLVMQNPQGQATRIVGVNFDITQRVEQERLLMAAQLAAEAASQAKSEFLANMSHEIRTPMTAIFGCVDTLLPSVTDKDQREVIQMIRNQGQHLLGILNDILDLSKIEAMRLEITLQPCSLLAIVENVKLLLNHQAREKLIDLEFEFDTNIPPTLITDPLRIQQILLNLVGNALKFTDQGRVCIRATYLPDPEGVDHVKFNIMDTGCGIADNNKTIIFEAFRQAGGNLSRRNGGTGLGLTICQQLTKLMGGKIHVESELGRGSNFEVIIPVEICNSNTTAQSQVLRLTSEGETLVDLALLKNKRVLIAEDTPGIQFILSRLLKPLVTHITMVANGEQAVHEVLHAIEVQEPYDLIVMDMQMPVMSGYEASQLLRDRQVKAPILALTAQAMQGDRERCLQAGCNDYLPKPIDREQLYKKLLILAQLIGVSE